MVYEEDSKFGIIREWLDEEGCILEDTYPTREQLMDVADELTVQGWLRSRSARHPVSVQQRLSVMWSVVEREEVAASDKRFYSPRSKSFFLVVISGALAAACCWILPSLMTNRADAGAIMLDRIIEVSQRKLDRSYRIEVVEEYDPDRPPKGLTVSPTKVTDELLEGAVLYVRSPWEFVFIRRLRDGQRRISGCDGRESWSFQEKGPIHVSHDLNRFRGGMPGQQQDLPLLSLPHHLEALTNGYEINLPPGVNPPASNSSLSELIATRKSTEVRGPKRVKIWFNSDSGMIHRMLLEGLPRQGGGPKSVQLWLISPHLLGQTNFEPDFFSHPSHHDPGRAIQYE